MPRYILIAIIVGIVATVVLSYFAIQRIRPHVEACEAAGNVWLPSESMCVGSPKASATEPAK